ncbi:MAG: pyruvate kinase, partial [Bacteroidetes bacterium]|nr:pyruvate kinase [Bacteroidota bacterium]
DVTDAIMVARGDLGVEMPFEKVPLLQKIMVEKCIMASKPVIIATQMMESMIENFRPTRAEATDVSNAVLDGADTLMLSGETSTGKFPVEVIKSMYSIIRHTEANAYRYYREHPPKDFNRTFLTDSVCYTAVKMAQQSTAKAIVVFTHSGSTAFKIAGYRPKADIYVFTNNTEILSRMSLLWGVRAFHFDVFTNIEKAIEYSIGILMNEKLIESDDLVIHVASTPIQLKGRANTLKLSYV